MQISIKKYVKLYFYLKIETIIYHINPKSSIKYQSYNGK